MFLTSRRLHTRCLSDWSTDVCSSDLRDVLDPTRLVEHAHPLGVAVVHHPHLEATVAHQRLEAEVLAAAEVGVQPELQEIGRAACRERLQLAEVVVVTE